ncbi:hypothetical protein GOBAR_AA08957 [Gossypium barbadense]|uniref:Proteasome endopeptidase complex n=1 Tax=Gossypium barbadense TaxID=3634 RepID=A0A2P5Y7W5_GOSBA|nr:hypothetical protein GOBAR_AA08957 [Gossypium barbadense]
MGKKGSGWFATVKEVFKSSRKDLPDKKVTGVRPFGVSLLVAGYDDNGPQLYQVDPSGSYFSWKASAIGKNVSNAKTFLEKRYTDDMELDDAVHTAILTLKEGLEGQISGKNIEIGIIGTDKKFRQAPL